MKAWIFQVARWSIKSLKEKMLRNTINHIHKVIFYFHLKQIFYCTVDISDDHSSIWENSSLEKWFLLNNQSLLFIATPFLPPTLPFFPFADIMILIFHWLCLCWSAEQEADVSISRAAPGIHHQRSAQETDSFILICICLVCQLGEHPHHPTHTVISD